MALIKTNSLAFRLIVGATLWIAAALLIGGLTLSALFRDSAERAFDARLLVQLDALVAASGIDVDGHFLVRRSLNDPRFHRPYSGWYWQISGNGRLLARSRSLWDQVLDSKTDTITGHYEYFGPDQQKLRVVNRSITLPGYRKTLSFVTTGAAAEIETEVRAFNKTLFYSLGMLGLGLIIAVFIQVRFGLLPMRKVLDALSAVRAGKKSRLEGRFPSEIQPLANEINGLIAHNGEVLERARTHVGNLAHALKTPLSILTNESTPHNDSFSTIVAKQTDTMRRHVDHYLAKARMAAASGVLGAQADVLPILEDLRRTLLRIHHERRIRIEASQDHPLIFRGEQRDLEEMLGNLIDNAGKWATRDIVITVKKQGKFLHIDIDDDGPGLDPTAREAAFQRGKRLDEAKPGSGLGLAIVRDTAGLYGGEVTLDDSPLGGVRVSLTLPAVLSEQR